MEVPTRKKARKGTFNASRNGDAIQMSGNALVSNIHLTYDILRIVFQYLNAKSLQAPQWFVGMYTRVYINDPCSI